MKKCLFRSKTVRTLAVLGAVLALPVSAASADTSGLLGQGSTSVYATAQGTSLLGYELPVIGTQGLTVTLPVNTSFVPSSLTNALDFTVDAPLTLGSLSLANLDVDPRMVR